ncbi:MAG: bifunctional diaminohydroxyphosphoribosylaminopyrimidine deaminase/5-amino-6-(5-phosphoribosylamino)uracil reductase RibD [Bauldia sp.]|nr:bifunctional diaminohydroxyphosphoribosylaminopyrimidine deaminase/5-amino-6-(5-phosphoribosylamino)uracil reductase RibD [Bauldia sp.]
MADAAPDAGLDRRYMAAALRLGRANLGRTFPNPAVGALIVRHEPSGPRIVGGGWTAAGGRPHAEVEALAEAGEEARGATAYVTLEPCAHEGHTPPCANALVAAGVSRVVTAIADPDPRVSGRGHAILEAAGIAVTTGVLAADARLAHGGHISRVTRGRPWVILKLAVSADGMIGRREGERMIITGRPAFERVQAIRSECDAVMVGIGTVLVDDPRLTVRLPGAEARDPIRIILDTNAVIGLDTNLVKSAREVPLWLMVSETAEAERVTLLEASGAVVVRVREGSGGLDIEAVFSALAERGLTRVLVEGGSRVASSLISAGLADEVILFRAPVVVGPDGVRALGGHALSAIERSPRYQLVAEQPLGEERMRRYLRTP